MSVRLAAVSFEAVDPAGVARFWAGVLGREAIVEARGVFVPGDETQVGLRFVPSTSEPDGPSRLHLHVTSTTRDDQHARIDLAMRLGARHVDVGQRPEEDHVVLADPGGEAFCVIGPTSNFLAGTGLLGEVTCDGTREVGLFWRDALGWPLVWDQDGETAVQSPLGGTKVSWGGPPVAVKRTRNRQRFDLVATELDGDVARLVDLGATRLAAADGGVELTDPDGNEFLVTPG